MCCSQYCVGGMQSTGEDCASDRGVCVAAQYKKSDRMDNNERLVAIAIGSELGPTLNGNTGPVTHQSVNFGKVGYLN